MLCDGPNVVWGWKRKLPWACLRLGQGGGGAWEHVGKGLVVVGSLVRGEKSCTVVCSNGLPIGGLAYS